MMEENNNNKYLGLGALLLLGVGFVAWNRSKDAPPLPSGTSGYSGGCNGGEAVNYSDYGLYVGSNGSQDESYLGMNLPNMRGVSNNNAGNIKTYFCKQGYDYWINELDKQFNTDGVFCQFSRFSWGLRAMIKLLRNYKLKHGINTIDTLIARYDVPTATHYMNFVSNETGISRNAIIDLTDKETLRKIVKAMVALECSGFQVSDAQFNLAYSQL